MTKHFLALLIALATIPAIAEELSFASKDESGLETWWIRQPLEHQHSEQGSFQQKIYIDRTYAVGPESPVILEINGEWQMGRAALATVAIAKKNHAIIVSIEHRYYGDSQPFQGSLTTEQLQHLTTANALADLKNAIEVLRSEQNMNGRWITSGCSYAGTLAAYFKAIHPEMVVGSLAFSAPVKAQSVWPGLDNMVTQSLGPSCAAKTKAALENKIHQIQTMDDDALNAFRERLGFENTRSRSAISEVLVDVVRWFAQKNQLEDFCDVIEVNPDNFDILIIWAVQQFGIDHVSYDAAADIQMKDSGALIRQWTYQTCTEFGWFQTSGGGFTPSLINNEHYIRFCSQHFGINKLPNTEAINALYYDKVLQSDSILFLNDKTDPWSDLSIRSDNLPNDRIQALETTDGYHCSAMWEDFTMSGEASSELGESLLKTAEGWLMPQHQSKP